jgi:hypothetical protein
MHPANDATRRQRRTTLRVARGERRYASPEANDATRRTQFRKKEHLIGF